nr:helix-turn-helix domain-containing protein [Zhihengliuella sp.]
MCMRFMRLEDVAEELNVNMPVVRGLVRSGELPAIQIGGRGLWRVERSEFEAYVERQYAASREAAEKHKSEQPAE